MTPTELAFRLIAVLEGVRLKSYWDVNGYSIGFGHKSKEIKENMTITLEQALKYFQDDVKPLAEMVKDKPVLEAAAWISFGYNLGIGTLRQVLANPSMYDVTHFNKAGGVVLSGLVNRRNLEDALIKVSRSMK